MLFTTTAPIRDIVNLITDDLLVKAAGLQRDTGHTHEVGGRGTQLIRLLIIPKERIFNRF